MFGHSETAPQFASSTYEELILRVLRSFSHCVHSLSHPERGICTCQLINVLRRSLHEFERTFRSPGQISVVFSSTHGRAATTVFIEDAARHTPDQPHAALLRGFRNPDLKASLCRPPLSTLARIITHFFPAFLDIVVVFLLLRRACLRLLLFFSRAESQSVVYRLHQVSPLGNLAG